MDIDLSRLSEAQLIELNHKIVGKLQSIQQARTYHQLAKFGPGERVWFTAQDGRRVEGHVVRVNKKTVSVHSDDHHNWNVSPGLLKKLEGKADVCEVIKPLEIMSAQADSDSMQSNPQDGVEGIQKTMEALWNEYSKTPLFLALPPETKRQAIPVLMFFSKFMHEYEGYEPERWTVSAAKQTFLETVPQKLDASDELYRAFRPVLASFFRFLATKNFMPEAGRLADDLDSTGDEFFRRAKERWTRKHSTPLSLVASTFASKNKVGRNDACPCGSGKKYKKCCLNEC